MATPMALENSGSIFEFTYTLQNPAIHAKNSSLFSTELKFVQFWLIFV